MRMIMIHLLAVALLGFVNLTSPAAEAPSDKPASDSKTSQAEKLFSQGRNALFQGQYQKAVDLLSQAVEADKTKTGYRLYLARAYRYAGKEAEAVTQLEEILKTTPDHVEAGQTLGEIYSAKKQWKDIIRVLEPLLKYRHDYPTYHMLAEAQYNLGEHGKARKNYEEAVKLNPQSALDHYQLGNIYLAGNCFALAAESYQSALRLGLDTSVLHYKLGSAYFNLRNYFGSISVQTVKSGKPGTIFEKWYLIEPAPGAKDAFRCAPTFPPSIRWPRPWPMALKTGPTSTCSWLRFILTPAETLRLMKCSTR